MKTMEVTVVVVYQNALAHYSVGVDKDEIYVARLLNYSGSSATLPPVRISFKKEGHCCTGDTYEQELIENVYEAVRQKMLQVSR